MMRPEVRRGTIVRPMSPMGIYWSQSSVYPDAAYVVRDDLIFTACHFDKDLHEADYYSDFDEPLPEEIRLLGSLALSVGPECGFMAQYACGTAIKLDEQHHLDDPYVIGEAENALRRSLHSYSQPARGAIPMPPSNYEHFHLALPGSVQRELWVNIDPGDHLTIRGLATLMKAASLNLHEAFGEEANYPLWISLDASFAIIQEVVHASGKASPTAVDCQTFIHQAFGEANSGLRYFEEFYADRIMTMHPQNRFGTFAFAPISRCDFYALHDALREVYRFLLLGRVVDPQRASEVSAPRYSDTRP